MPRAHDFPSFQVSTTETLTPGNPLGMKGCGEAGAIGSPPAVINAVTDALGDNTITMPRDLEKCGAFCRPEASGRPPNETTGEELPCHRHARA
jgi:carbon-monoxide dehydrogenase large subunit